MLFHLYFIYLCAQVAVSSWWRCISVSKVRQPASSCHTSTLWEMHKRPSEHTGCCSAQKYLTLQYTEINGLDIGKVDNNARFVGGWGGVGGGEASLWYLSTPQVFIAPHGFRQQYTSKIYCWPPSLVSPQIDYWSTTLESLLLRYQTVERTWRWWRG